MKNICFVINKLTDGGAERVTSVVANSFSQKKDYNVKIVTFEKHKKEEEYDLDEKIARYNIELSNEGKYMSMINNFFRVRKYLLNLNCDYYIGIDILANLLVSFLGMTSNVKTIISERNAPKQVNLRTINRILRGILYPFADRIVFQTKGAMEDSPRKLRKKGVIIANPIKDNLPMYCPKNKVVCASGRLVEQKNYTMLIDAFERVSFKHPEYKLSIYGQGILKDLITDYISKKNLQEKIILEGYYEDIHSVMKYNQIYVLSSDFEGLPNSLMEAMAMGFPVISTDCPPGGPKSLIKNGENGYLVPVNDCVEMEEKLSLLIENKEIREKFSNNAKKVRDKYSSEVITQKWEKAIEGI